MSKQAKQIEFYKAAHRQFKDMLVDQHWQDSVLLKQTHHVFTELLTHFQAAIENEDPCFQKVEEKQPEQDDSLYMNVYVSLYCATGELHDWEKILKNIGKQVISRPILVSEEEMKTLIRSKPHPKSEAYVVLHLLESNVIRKGTAERNELGHDMVSIKDARLDLESIQYFVHDHQKFSFQHGLLTPVQKVE